MKQYIIGIIGGVIGLFIGCIITGLIYRSAPISELEKHMNYIHYQGFLYGKTSYAIGIILGSEIDSIGNITITKPDLKMADKIAESIYKDNYPNAQTIKP